MRNFEKCTAFFFVVLFKSNLKTKNCFGVSHHREKKKKNAEASRSAKVSNGEGEMQKKKSANCFS